MNQQIANSAYRNTVIGILAIGTENNYTIFIRYVEGRSHRTYMFSKTIMVHTSRLDFNQFWLSLRMGTVNQVYFHFAVIPIEVEFWRF